MFKFKNQEVVGLFIRPTLRSTFLQGGLYSETCTVFLANGRKKQITNIKQLEWVEDGPPPQSLKAYEERDQRRRRVIDDLFTAGSELQIPGLKGGLK